MTTWLVRTARIFGLLLALRAAMVYAIETTYGEDPVPNTHRMRRPFQVYGMDPVPEKSLLERWQEFKQRDRGQLWRSRPAFTKERKWAATPSEAPAIRDADQRPESSRRNW